MTKYIDADLYVEMQIYDDECEEWSLWNGTIEDLLNQWTEQGCPPTIEVSEDYISRQALIDEVLEDGNGAVLSYTAGMYEDELVERIEKQMIQHFIGVIKYAPPVVVERKQGCWRKTEHRGETFWECSQCGLIHKYASNYCDSCGADMRGIK